MPAMFERPEFYCPNCAHQYQVDFHYQLYGIMALVIHHGNKWCFREAFRFWWNPQEHLTTIPAVPSPDPDTFYAEMAEAL
jgi:hypothetical protein